jgi:uncharacterized membrane protein YgaE (UPF0421/DUF939 family)
MNEEDIFTPKVIFAYITAKLKGFKTLLFTIIVAVFALLEATDLTGIISEEKMPFVVLGIAITNIILRKISNTPIGKNR